MEKQIKNKVGLKDIAAELNLSLTAVSRALRGLDDISEETKAKVRQKAQELGYTPNLSAQSLATGYSNAIAIFVDNIRSPYFGMVIEKMIVTLKQKGFITYILPVSDYKLRKESFVDALRLRADAIISFLVPTKETVDLSITNDLPLMLFGRNTEYEEVNIFLVDDIKGGELAGDYLINTKGAKKPCYISVPYIDCDKYRFRGFENSMKKNKITNYKVITHENLQADVEQMIKEGCDGFFCFDDELVNKIIRLFPDGNIKNVVGYNGTSQFFDYMHDFTSVTTDYDYMINDALTQFIEIIKKEGGVARRIKIKYKPFLHEVDN